MAKAKTYNDIIEQAKSSNLVDIKRHNIIHAGLEFSGMIRLLKENNKPILYRKFVETINCFFQMENKNSFDELHSKLCEWGTKNIWLAENKKHNKPERLISYGQIAKTLNVVLKVAIHYSQLPDEQKANSIRPWLHAAVDTEMMKMLKSKYKQEMTNSWPKSNEDVCRDQYFQIQNFVRDFIAQNHSVEQINAVDFDDIYWNLLNKKGHDQTNDE